jgi:hypothetical protein
LADSESDYPGQTPTIPSTLQRVESPFEIVRDHRVDDATLSETSARVESLLRSRVTIGLMMQRFSALGIFEP